MAKLENKYPEFDCVEYDYGDLAPREYEGEIRANLKFKDGIEIYYYFEFKDFLDYHKRKRTDFHRLSDKIYSEMVGWGSRYFEFIELLQEEVENIDLFVLFVEYINLFPEEVNQKYVTMRQQVENVKKISNNKPPVLNVEKKEPVVVSEKKEAIYIEDDNEVVAEEDEEDEDEVSPYDRDREKFEELLKDATNDMYETLKERFFPQMDYFQRRYPSKWKLLIENIEAQMQNFEDELLHEMMPELDEDEYREYDIKYNSQKADMSEEDEPPTAR